jgi:transcription elongation factor Elf1
MVVVLSLTHNTKQIEKINVTSLNHKKKIQKQQIRIAFVDYRDFGDSRQFEVLDFTDSVDTFRLFCDAIASMNDGNTDNEEDVFGGLQEAIGLSWNPTEG